MHRSAAARTIELRGKLADLQAAFHADVCMYHHSTGTYREHNLEQLGPYGFQDLAAALAVAQSGPQVHVLRPGRDGIDSKID